MRWTTLEIRAGLIAILLPALCVPCVRAGDLTTDNLTVRNSAELWGSLRVGGPELATAPTNGLLLYYSFSTSAASVPDDSGNGYAATTHGAAWVTNGITGGAYSFNGTTDYMVTANNVPLNLTQSAFTFSGWVKMTYAAPSPSYASSPVSCAFANIGFSVTCYYGSGAGGCYTWCAGVSGGGSANPAASFSYGAWHHIVVVYPTSNSNTRLTYVDGAYVKTESAGTPGNFTGVVKVGAAGYGQEPPMIVDEVRIYNRALSAAEVTSLYLHDLDLTAGEVEFSEGVKYMAPRGDLPMGIYTNSP